MSGKGIVLQRAVAANTHPISYDGSGPDLDITIPNGRHSLIRGDGGK